MVFLADIVLAVVNSYDTKSQSSYQDLVHCCSPQWVVRLYVVDMFLSFSFY